MTRLSGLVSAIVLWPFVALAGGLEVQNVAPGIWAIEGPAEQRSAGNLANNATFGVIETAEGVVLVDPGGSWRGAAALHEVIRGLTEQPVTHVINTGGQDHRWLGNGYWQALGAKVIASEDAVADQAERASVQLTALSTLMGAEALAGTEPSHAEVRFDTAHDLTLGGVEIQIRHPAAAHTPGDSFVWLPGARAVFTGDIVYLGRILGVMGFSDSAAWLESFAAIEALNPEHLVPGHGPASDLAQARAETRDYLRNLRDRIGAHIDEGGDIIGSVKIDQSAFAHLEQFDALAGRNAQAVFEQMEWE